MKNLPTYSRLIVGSVLTLSILLCCLLWNVQTLSNTADLERSERKEEKSAGVSCLSNNEPKPDVKIRLGLLNRKTMKMPKPTYPIEARRKGISGEVKVEVVIDMNTGVIEWAQITTGAPLLQEAVSKVICRVRFFPTIDVDGRASGYLIYEFRSLHKTA